MAGPFDTDLDRDLDTPSLTLRRRLKAAPEKVWQAWTQPAQMMRWLGVTPHPNKPVIEADLRVGGGYSLQYWLPDGTHRTVSGVYREIEPGRKLVFSWRRNATPDRESLVTVEIEPDRPGSESGCLLTLTHRQFFDAAERDDHRGGWDRTLDGLERLFA